MIVIPAKAGIQLIGKVSHHHYRSQDSRFRGNELKKQCDRHMSPVDNLLHRSRKEPVDNSKKYWISAAR